MAILEGDIKLMQSQRMTDNTDGGGRITGNEIVDGVSNAIFDDVSDLDRTTGNVALRKVFPTVITGDTDTYLGSNMIIAEQPQDPNVFVTMFTTNDHDDLRADARDSIERYVVQSSAADWDLLGNHYTNQQIVIGVQRLDRDLPAVGDVYVLENDLEENQYVKVTQIEAAQVTYAAFVNGVYTEFERMRLDMEISSPLLKDFPGGDPYLIGTLMPAGSTREASEVFRTEVADASRYWGIQNTSAIGNLNDLEITVDDIYTALVPSAQSETPIVDAALYPTRPVIQQTMASGTVTDTFKLSYLGSTTVRGYLLRAAVRGTTTISIDGSVFVDQSDGTLTRTSGSSPFNTLEIEYESGLITGTRVSGSGSGVLTGTVTYESGVGFGGKRVADFTEITLNNRGYNYTETWPNEKPKPGTMNISYMVLGQWYTLEDDGSGQITGSGSGSINFTTGTVAITLEALPDVDSDIIWAYVVNLADETTERSGTVAKSTSITTTIEEGSEPGTIVVTYTSGATQYTLTDVAVVGELAGDGTGTVDYANGKVEFQPDLLPDDATNVDVVYDYAANNTYNDPSPSISNNVYTVTIPNAPLRPGSVTMSFLYSYDWYSYQQVTRERTLRDDGVGGFIGTIGTIDYATGIVNITILNDYVRITRYWWGYNWNTDTYERTSYQRNYAKNEQVDGSILIKYKPASASDAGSSVTLPIDNVTLQLVETREQIIPLSMRMVMAGKTYYDRDGIVYTDFDSATGAGTQVGTIDYTSAEVRLDAWEKGIAPNAAITALATTTAELAVSEIAFRTPAAPIRPQSMQITITDVNGNILTDAVGLDGTYDGSQNIQGTTNVNTGVSRIFFNDGAAAVECFAETGRYNAIVITSLPLNEELIGLNPVRLPSDGRVPIYRAGDVVVVHNTQYTQFANPAQPSETLNTRVRLAYYRVEDVNGLEVSTDQYSVDPDTGVFTLDAGLDLLGYVEPISAVHRVEDMNLVSGVDISGRLTLTSPLSHEFPALTSYVSTALIINDMQARYTNLFDQETWTEVWSDTIIGGEPAAEYNEAVYPIEVTNAGTLQQRWALVFTGSTSFNIIGETVGLIGTGTTGADISPLNPNNAVPYFTLQAAGWGAGWGAGNVLRFNTIGAAYPVWIARTVMQSDPTVQSDTFRVQIRGNVNA